MVGLQEVNFEMIGGGTSLIDQQKDFCNHEKCRECRGFFCCQQTGCALSPKDIYVLKNPFPKEVRVLYLISLLKRGYLSIEYWPVKGWGEIGITGILPEAGSIQKNGILYIRAKNEGRGIIDILHYKWEKRTPCASWSYEEGCKFPFHKRPKGGRELIPGPIPELCVPVYPEWKAADEWKQFSEEMAQVYEYFRDKGCK